jgi:hypothetical protein
MLTRDAKGVSIWKEETIHPERTRGEAKGVVTVQSRLGVSVGGDPISRGPLPGCARRAVRWARVPSRTLCLLAQRFGAVAPSWQKRIRGAKLATLERWFKRAIVAPDLPSVFNPPR